MATLLPTGVELDLLVRAGPGLVQLLPAAALIVVGALAARELATR